MASIGEYIAGRGEAPTRRELNRLIDRYEWFTTARRVRAIVTGDPDPALVLPLMFRPTVPLAAPLTLRHREDQIPESIWDSTPVERCRPQADGVAADLIDRFISQGGYRIDPTGEAHEAKVDIDIDPEMVSEELAGIYRSQGFVAEAEKIDLLLKSRT